MQLLNAGVQSVSSTLSDSSIGAADQTDIVTELTTASAAIQDPGSSTGTVSQAGSGMVFDNTFGSGVTAAFEAAVVAAENFLAAHFTDAVTFHCAFDLGALGAGFAGQNSYSPVYVSYSDLKAALASHASTADDRAAVGSLPVADPSSGQGFALAAGQARILGLGGVSPGVDDTIVLNSSLPWTYGQDAIGVLEHEITEGCMGRFGGLGVSNQLWGPMDLFRYSSPGQRDYSGGADGQATYFSADGHALTLQFHNAISSTGVNDGFDLADWDNTQGDSFGSGGPGASGTMSLTDLQVMDVLGWTPAASGAPLDLSASTTSVAFNLETLSADSSFGHTALKGGGGTLVGSTHNDSLIVGINDGVYTFDGRVGSNSVLVDGVGRAATVISGTSSTGIHIGITGTTINALNTQQVQFIDGTVEYDPTSFGAEVMRLYEAAFGRLPDAPGLAYWAVAGMPLTSIAAGFIRSAEFQSSFSAVTRSTSSFVTQLYANVLHRAPDASGLAAWSKAVDGGSLTTAQVLIGFSESREHVATTLPKMQNGLYVANQQAAQVARLYYTTLNRPPDFGGLSGWVGKLQSGQMTLLQEAESFSKSLEFLTEHSTLDNLGFIDLLYSNVLHRTADLLGEAAWTTALNNSTLTRGGVVLGFSQSQELITRLAPVIENHGITFV